MSGPGLIQCAVDNQRQQDMCQNQAKLIIDLGREQSVLLYFPVNNKSCLVRYAIHVLALPMLKAKHKYSPPPSPCMQHPSTKATHLVLSFSCPLKCQQCKPLPKLFVPRTNISIKTKFRQALPCETWPSINSWGFMPCYWNSLIQKLTI